MAALPPPPPVHTKIIIYQKCKPAKRLGESQRRRKGEGKQKRKDEGNQSREWRDVIGDQRIRLSRRPLCIMTSWRPNPKWFQCVCGWRRDIQEEIKPRNNFIMHTPCFPCTLRNRVLQVTPLDDVESPSEEAFSRVQTQDLTFWVFQMTVMGSWHFVKKLPVNENVWH